MFRELPNHMHTPTINFCRCRSSRIEDNKSYAEELRTNIPPITTEDSVTSNSQETDHNTTGPPSSDGTYNQGSMTSIPGTITEDFVASTLRETADIIPYVLCHGWSCEGLIPLVVTIVIALVLVLIVAYLSSNEF